MGEKTRPCKSNGSSKKFDRKDKDIDNDGDVILQQIFTQEKKAISKAIKGDEKSNVRECKRYSNDDER